MFSRNAAMKSPFGNYTSWLETLLCWPCYIFTRRERPLAVGAFALVNALIVYALTHMETPLELGKLLAMGTAYFIGALAVCGCVRMILMDCWPETFKDREASAAAGAGEATAASKASGAENAPATDGTEPHAAELAVGEPGDTDEAEETTPEMTGPEMLCQLACALSSVPPMIAISGLYTKYILMPLALAGLSAVRTIVIAISWQNVVTGIVALGGAGLVACCAIHARRRKARAS
jgi:hypothetical protein